MPWFKVDDGLHSHPKFMDLPLESVGLWTMAGAFSSAYLTDGLITHRQVARLGGTEDDARALVDAGLWDEADNGYKFHDWEDYQPTRAQVESERAAARERMRKRRRNVGGQFEGGSPEVRPNTQRTSGEVRELSLIHI